MIVSSQVMTRGRRLDVFIEKADDMQVEQETASSLTAGQFQDRFLLCLFPDVLPYTSTRPRRRSAVLLAVVRHAA